jgi:hypothetical protein
MRMKRLIPVSALFSAPFVLGCGRENAADVPRVGVEAITAVLTSRSDARPVKLNHHELVPLWAITKDQELACGGSAIAGARVGGKGDFTHLGEASVDVSAAWDIGNLLKTPPKYRPEGPASGPVAPVIGQSGYPYAFHRNPETGTCGQAVTATGKVTLTAASGDRLYGNITGGEVHKLDFIIDGDGIEAFFEVSVTGGTGRFSAATGAFVVHTIARLQPTLKFKMTLAEILPGGTVGY